jgi:dTDP-4-amino-4,6-dideoxygalactose transaminase
VSKDEEKKHISGGETEGGITSSYATDDGVRLKVPYSFFGSIYDEAEEKAVLAAMKQDTLTMGPKTAEFQKKFAAMCGVKHALACSNCTSGMHIATQLFDIRPGDDVIITPTTFIATTLVVLKEGGLPIYADIDPRTYNIDPKKIEEKITPKTKAIYIVHYGGLMCDMDPIMDIALKHKLYVLEDCAHAVGAEYKGRKAGSVGDVGVFSFHSLKNITTCGEGGMITTNNDLFADGIEKLRCMNLKNWDVDQTKWRFGHVSIEKESRIDYWIPSHFDVDDWNGHWGCNYRMNEIQAAVGCTQLDKLEMLTAKRREIGHKLTAGLTGIEGITPVYEPEDCKHVYHLYTVCVEEDNLGASRDDFLRVLYKEEGIQGILHYQPTYHFTGLKKLGLAQDLCPNAEKFFYQREFNLPMHPRLTDNDVDAMIQGIRSAAKKVRGKRKTIS